MPIKYVIEGVEFFTDRNSLTSKFLSGEEVVLTTPASQCLELLLQAAPATVTHEEFFKEIWEVKGMHIPHNTLYQNISHIRKALKKASNSNKEFIVTVPRVGFKMSQTLEISYHTETDSCACHQEIKKSSLTNVQNKSISIIKEYFSGKKQTYTILFFIISFCIMAFFYTLSSKPGNNYFKDYTIINKTAGCEYFSNPDIIDKDLLLERIRQDNFRCNLFPYVYITALPSAATLSVLSCARKVDNDNSNCVSFIYYGSQTK